MFYAVMVSKLVKFNGVAQHEARITCRETTRTFRLSAVEADFHADN